MNGQAVGNIPTVGNIPMSEVQEYCAQGGSACHGNCTYAITAEHGTYPQNTTDAENFIIKTAGLSYIFLWKHPSLI